MIRRGLAVLALAVAPLAATGAGTVATAGGVAPRAPAARLSPAVVAAGEMSGARGGPCVGAPASRHYSHVVWIVMENEGFGQVADSAAAPFLRRLGSECGLATDYLAVAHPSLPNYLAMTSGSTDGVTDDADPIVHRLSERSIFSQLSGGWRALEDAMPGPCDRVTSGLYAARHDPAVYFTDLRATCARDVVPLRYPLDLSARFTFITPDVCNDMHSCPIATGDEWLAKTVGSIVSSSQYRAGGTALFVVWDESEAAGANRVAAYVVAPSVPRGSRVDAPFTHYSLLATAEDLLGLPRLGAARTARSMVVPFHL